MERKVISTLWDRKTRNDINTDFDYLFRGVGTLNKTITNLVVEAGDANPEVIQARGGEDVLNDRLNNLEGALNDKTGVVVSKNEPDKADIWFEEI